MDSEGAEQGQQPPGDYLVWCEQQLGPKWRNMATLHLPTRDGASLPVHRDILGAVCKAASELAEAEGEPQAAPTPPGQPSLAALSVLSQQCSTAAVRCLLGEVYACSGMVRPPPGAAGLAAWDALSPDDQADAVRLADMLDCGTVLARWDELIAEGASRAVSSNLLINRLMLADRFQQQLPLTYTACLEMVTARALRGDAAAVGLVPDLSRASCAAVVTHMATASAIDAAERSAAAAEHADRESRLQHARQWAAAADQWIADADLRAVKAEQWAADAEQRAAAAEQRALNAEHQAAASVQTARAVTDLSALLERRAEAAEGRLSEHRRKLGGRVRRLRLWMVVQLVLGAAAVGLAFLYARGKRRAASQS